MGNFQGGGNRDNRGGGFRGGNGGGFKKSFGGDRGGNRGGDRGPVSMHKATCNECGNGCEVPFRPSGDKPVYCNDCFASKRDDGDRAPRREFNGPKRDFNSKPSYSDDKPSSNNSFAKPISFGAEEMKREFKDVGMKLDRLINAIEMMNNSKSENKTEVKKENNTVVVKNVAKAKPAVKSSPIAKPLAKKQTKEVKKVEVKSTVKKPTPKKKK